ncbi:hypothetical protein V1525DRAFT_369859 [Lipomyces kononenkoae]|uniref:Uncharacterized protein n=1 Tax=Lipomyces kononenkoae TaxID=34357 RepID=A0ACC3TAV6_LIPKO
MATVFSISSPFATALPHQVLDNSHHHRRPLSPKNMAGQPGPTQVAVPQLQPSPVPADSAIPRKRSKVSRACDECRRKKIRCDATPENGPEQCSSCQRVGDKCSFSRIPMKRGPSKGYIKELEDRLNTLENSFSSGEVVPTSRRNSAISVEARPSNDSSSSAPNPTAQHKASISSTGSNNYPADSPSSQYSSSYTFGYQTVGSPRTVIPEQSRPRTDSINSLPPPHQPSQNPQPGVLNSPTLNPAVPSLSGQQRKRAFSSTAEYSNELNRPMPPLKSPFSSSSSAPERLPSIDSFKFDSASSTSQLPSLHGSANSSVVDEPAPPYMAPPNGPNHYWKPPYETGGSRSVGGVQQPLPQARLLQRHSIGSGMMRTYESSLSESHRTAADDALFPFTWEDDAVDAYYRHIHAIFPVLAQSRSRLRSRLVATTSPIRNACLYAVYALVRGMVSPQRGEQDLHRAIHQLSEAQKDTSRLPLASSLLIIQTMVLLALEADNHGPEALDTSLRSRSHWLGAAIGLSHSLRLHVTPTSLADQATSPSPDVSDIDSDVRQGRRIYLVICMLDRWHAVSLSVPLQIPDRTIHLVADDHVTLTTVPYHLIRLSLVLGHIVESAGMTDDISSGSRHNYIATVLRGELERVRESIEEVWDAKPELEIAYWHVKLAILRLLQVPDPHVLVGPATRIIGFLVPRMKSAQAALSVLPPSNAAIVGISPAAQAWMSPLDHHFLALAVVTLLDLTDVHETREDAWRSLNLVLDCLPHTREPAKWEDCVRGAIEARKRTATVGASNGAGSSSGLERLAAIAVGEATAAAAGGGGGARMVAENVKLRRLGYLGYLAFN